MRRPLLAAALSVLLLTACNGEDAEPGPDLGDPDDSTVIEPTDPPQDLQGG